MCRKFTSLLLLSLSLSLISILSVCAQNGPDHNKKLQTYPNNEEEYYIRFMLWNQMWAQVMHQSPGTLINDVPLDLTFGVGTRHMHTQIDGTTSLQNTGLQSQDVILLVGDISLDLPFGDEARNKALLAYSTFYHDGFGPHYLSYMGTMKIGASDPTYEGYRARYGTVNTGRMLVVGNTYHIQGGWLQPKFKKTDKIKCCHSPPVATKNWMPCSKTEITLT